MTAGSIDTTSGSGPLAVVDAVDEAPRTTEDHEPTHLEYLPGLDGLRALAVLAVMSGHLPYLSTIRPKWLDGSWLGVSTFFTMSGFLITRLLLAERARTGTVSLGGFWSRRARRLLPALYTCIAFLLLLSVLHIAPPDEQMGHQVLALVLYFKNGLLLYLHGPNGPTFFQMWSLSIEEQFYLLFPLLFLGASMWLRRRAWILFAGIALLAQIWMISNNRRATFGGYVTAYFGTPARSAEVLVGVLLAYLMTSAWWRRAVTVRSSKLVRQAIGVAGLIGLIYVFRAAVVTWDETYRWTMLTSLATVAIIIACTTTGGATSLLSWRPLRWIGKVSYGAYVYHLGVFFLLTSSRTGITSDFGLSVVRYVATFVLAGLSYRYIEAPLRHRTTPRGWRLAVAYGSVGALLVVLAFVLPTNEQAPIGKAAGPFAATNADASTTASNVALIGDRSLDASIPGMAALARSERGKYFVGELRFDACPLSNPAMLVVAGELRVQLRRLRLLARGHRQGEDERAGGGAAARRRGPARPAARRRHPDAPRREVDR